MSEINGVQLARLWARAWWGIKKNNDPSFKNLLETDPLAAATQFHQECIQNGHPRFPDPSQASLLNLGEYQQAVVNFKNIPPGRLDKIMRKNEAMEWTKSKFLNPDELRDALVNGAHEIY
jgi:hypothetical protein